MVAGVDMALSEITLVLFTTLAPSGTIAFLIMGAMSYCGRVDDALRRSIDMHLYIPLVIALVGLVMSATHLGNPSNVLYVFSRMGQSPLSNEVAGAAVFLALAGVYWLDSFSRTLRLRFRKVWFALICVAGVAFVTLMAFAYKAETIISWDTPYVPVGLWLSALAGGPALALASLRFAHADFVRGRMARVLLGVSATALVVGTACALLQNASLSGVANELSSAMDLVPFYRAFISAFTLFGAVSIVLMRINLRRSGGRSLGFDIVSCLLMFAGIFLMRFSFYAMHLTVGLGM